MLLSAIIQNNSSMNPWIFVAIVTFLGLASAIEPIDTSISGNESIIYGVRWFLGEKFRFQKPIGKKYDQQHQSHLVLFFNSEKQWENHTFTAIIQEYQYHCSVTEIKVNVSSNHHQQFNEFASSIGGEFINYIYKCPILFEDSAFLKKSSQFAYKIVVQGSKINQTLVEAKLRSPLYNLTRFSLTTFGDWGKMTSFSPQYNKSIPIDDCLSQRINKDENIRLMLLLGDLAYDIQGKSYVQFMKYLQQYSRQIVLLFSPGNHETIKHKDIFLLAKESFYSPSWRYFYGYFDLVQLGEYVFVGVNTQAYFWDGLAVESNSSLFTIELQEDYISFQNLFQMQLPQQTITELKNNYKVIGYSHYPIYCSEEDNHEKCSFYHDRHSKVLQVYRKLGMQLYLSGHLHIYERSKQICQNGAIFREGTKIDNTSIFRNEGDCSIFIIEGAAGNNYYVQTERHFPLKNHSGAFVNNTGFGLLQLTQNQMRFQHISANEACFVADRIIINDEKAELIIEIQGDMQEIRLLYIMQGFLVLISLLIAASIFWRRRVHKRRQAHKLAQRSMQNVSQFVQLSIA